MTLIKFCSTHISSSINQIKLYSVTILGNLARQKLPSNGNSNAAEVSKLCLPSLINGIRRDEDKDFQQVCIRCLAATLERNKESRKLLIKADPRLSIIGNILTHDEEDARGNSALVISNCIEIIQDDPSDLIKPLINLVDEAKSKSNRTNAAIALSKAAKYSEKCREKFREHHGLEILQSRMSQIK